jgi:MFS family permease
MTRNKIGLTLSISDLIFIVFMIDRVGRRKPLLWGTVGITLALIAEAIVNSQINKESPQHGLSYAGVAFLFCVSVIFSCRVQPFPRLYSKS